MIVIQRASLLVLLLCFLSPLSLHGEDMVEVSATLVPVGQTNVKNLSQLELRREVALAQNRNTRDLLKLSVVVESGKWASIKRGREFWYPTEYSEARVHPIPSDDGAYSVPVGAPAPGNSSIVLPNCPTIMTFTDLGAQLKVRPTVRDGGLISLEGQLRDTAFEGFSGEAIPVKVKTPQLVGGNREVHIVDSHIGQPIFQRVDETFSVMLPYAAGSSANAALLREAQKEYTYFIPMELGNNIFGAHGKLELKNETPDPKGIIRSTMMKASQVKDFFIRPKDKVVVRDNGILMLNVKKIVLPHSSASGTTQKIHIETRFFESDEKGLNEQPVLSPEEYTQKMKVFASQKGVTALSAPDIVLNSGQNGKIEVFQEFIFPSRFQAPFLVATVSKGYPAQPSIPSSFETRKIGTTMDIKASAEADGRIRLFVDFNQMELEGLLNYGVPIYAVRTQLVKKLKTNVALENQAEAPVLPFRRATTELVVPSGAAAALTMIFDYQNKDHRKDPFLKVVGRGKMEEIQSPRYLTVFVRPRFQ